MRGRREETDRVGPARGALVAVGGGSVRETGIARRFVALAGGPSAPIVVIPTAREPVGDGQVPDDIGALMDAGALRLSVLDTRDRDVADSEEFVAPLREAGGVWFGGGRQWRLADAYLHTRTHDALWGVLERGGVIGGTSAGATIQGSFLARGDTKTADIMVGDHQEGLGLLKNVAIDQHWLARNRQFDLIEVIDRFPHLLGLGIDESTAIVVQGDRFEVIGRSYVGIFDATKRLTPHGRFYLLPPGSQFDLKTRTARTAVREQRELGKLIPLEEVPVRPRKVGRRVARGRSSK